MPRTGLTTHKRRNIYVTIPNPDGLFFTLMNSWTLAYLILDQRAKAYPLA
ncbi:hypothetical protein [Leptolyngbya sp. FACHB-16]|nr:hypothetical protein [Leptolyngbya sp. FACHB-16]MBD1910509.1 hypothetical protein [Leptolyngbya sp. FACHB-8]MBD2153880.1 hypothetical protein [Leptolyngbya sp. FACHB-16]